MKQFHLYVNKNKAVPLFFTDEESAMEYMLTLVLMYPQRDYQIEEVTR